MGARYKRPGRLRLPKQDVAHLPLEARWPSLECHCWKGSIPPVPVVAMAPLSAPGPDCISWGGGGYDMKFADHCVKFSNKLLCALSHTVSHTWKDPTNICKIKALSPFKSFLKTLLFYHIYKNLDNGYRLLVCWDHYLSWWPILTHCFLLPPVHESLVLYLVYKLFRVGTLF